MTTKSVGGSTTPQKVGDIYLTLVKNFILILTCVDFHCEL